MTRARLLVISAAIVVFELFLAAPASAQFATCTLPSETCPAGCTACYQQEVSCTFVAGCGQACPFGTEEVGLSVCIEGFSVKPLRTCKQTGSTDTAVCAVCAPGSAGSRCQYTDAGTCGGRGTATSSGTCICRPNFSGQNCDFCAANWYGFSPIPLFACSAYCVAATTCSGHGVCAGGGGCDCSPGFTGPSCSACALDRYAYPSCTFCTAAATCSGHGACTTTGTCACATGFNGASCNQCDANRFGPGCLACPGSEVSFSSGAVLSVCNGHGTCSAGITGSGACSCSPGYLGSDCGNPQIHALSPGAGPTLGLNVLTITGELFGTPGAVTVGGVPCGIRSWGPTQITCTVPAGQGAGRPVVVTKNGGALSLPVNYNYLAPSITSVSPATAPQSGGTEILIAGTNLGLTPTVSINSSPCASLTVVSPHSLVKCTTPVFTHGGSTVLFLSVGGQAALLVPFVITSDPINCAPGRYVSEGFCTICPAGTFSAGGSTTSCTPCAAGTFAADWGASSCSACPANTYTNAVGSSACAACAQGTTSSVGALACVDAAAPASLVLRGECVALDPSDPSWRLARFGYENRFENGGQPLTRSYGADNNVTIADQDAGVLSGAPPLLAAGLHDNAFGVRFTPGQTVRWNVLDPRTQRVVSAIVNEATIACDPTIGPQGVAGVQGPDGAPGVPGPPGPAGATGAEGVIGPTGAQGPGGQLGSRGPVGPTGPAGAMGPPGAAGQNGATGATGATGPIGPAGESGRDGDAGAQGSAGPQGLAGPQGPAGPRGPLGPIGSPGDKGEAGAQGPVGTPAFLLPGTLIFLFEGEPVPAGFTYVSSFKQNLADKNAANVVIRMYRKN